MGYVGKCGRAGEATHNNIIRRMRFAGWITKATNTHSEYVIHIAFTRKLVTRTRLNITSYVHCLSCSELDLWWLRTGRECA
jgi:hypothetical protein